MMLLVFLLLKLASTPDEKDLGLMGVSHLPDNEAMLFVFDKPQPPHFWSLGCLIPLDVGFLDDDLILREIHHLPCHPVWQNRPAIHTRRQLDEALQNRFCPYSLASSDKPYRYVIELSSGWFERHQIDVGAKLSLDGHFSP
jgi:uncharacterized membrane protein (UPF0127 family)